MNRRKFYNENNHLTDSELNLIIKAAYKEANLFEMWNFRRLLKKKAEAGKIFREYKSTYSTLNMIKPDECPDEIIKIIEKKTALYNSEKPALLFDLYHAFFVKPAVTVATIVVLLTAVATSVYLHNANYYDHFDIAEVEAADQQARYALSLIGKVFKTTKNSITEDILTDKVSKPINEGIKTVNKLFIEGETK